MTAAASDLPHPQVRRRPDVLWRASGGTVVLLTPDAEIPLALGGSGAALWELLIDPIHPDELVRALALRHDVTLDIVQADVERALAQMAAHGLLEVLS